MLTLNLLTSYAAGFPASPSPSRENSEGRTMSDGFGPNSPGFLMSYDPDTRCWRTSQACLFGGWETFSGTFPCSGMTRSGFLFQRASLVCNIEDGESLLLPTPNANALISFWASAQKLAEGKKFRASGARIGSNLSWILGKWHLQNGGERDNELIPDPCFYEVVMGFPHNWTDLEG